MPAQPRPHITVGLSLAALVGLPAAALAQSGREAAAADRAEDEAAIATVIRQIEIAWAEGDPESLAAGFAADADFLAPMGVRLAGREAIAGGHAGVLETIYADADLRHENPRVRFFDDDAAIVTMDAMIHAAPGTEPQGSAERPLLATAVMSEDENGEWSIQYYETVYAAPDDFALPEAEAEDDAPGD